MTQPIGVAAAPIFIDASKAGAAKNYCATLRSTSARAFIDQDTGNVSTIS